MAATIEHIIKETDPSLFLRQAIKNNDLNEVKLLLSQGADVNSRDENSRTALHEAAQANQDDSHYTIIEELLKNGAKVNLQDKIGNTPLHWMLRQSDKKTIQLMLDFNADFEIKNKFGEVALITAVAGSRNTLEIIMLLIENGANVNATCKERLTPLHWLCEWLMKKDHVKVAKLFLKNGANIEALDDLNRTPLMCLPPDYFAQPLLEFFCKYANFKNFNFDPRKTEIFLYFVKEIQSTLLSHIAKLITLGLMIHPSFFQEVLQKEVHRVYFNECKEELILAKSTKLKNCWVTYFNLLMDSKRKLKNYAGNHVLIENFKISDRLKKFPIYGAAMQKNVEKGIKRRELFDESTVILSKCLPIFNPTHLIIGGILDYLTYKDYVVFISKQ